MKFPTLFKPGIIRNMKVRNRIVMAALGTGLVNTDGYITQRMIDYYEARAKGGVGLIISQISSISATYTPPLIPRLFDDKYIPGLRELSQTAHRHGAKMAMQLGFPGISLLHQWKEIGIEAAMEVVGPSPVPCVTYGVTPRALTREEIKEIVKDFGKAAIRVKEAGYDAVEIRGSHGYFISAFLSPFKNRRSDEYGGSVENRARLACEIISAVREEVGNDFPIIFRMNGSDFFSGGMTLEQAVRQAPLFVQAGADALHVSAGVPESREWRDLTYYHPSGALVPLAHAIKKVVKVPVITVGKIGDPVLAEEILTEERADFVGMARALFADPELPNKARNGRMREITRCLYCNNCRVSPNSSDIMKSIGVIRTCTVNPSVLRERDFHLKRTKSPKRVMIIGGGLAGLEAAIIAAKRGHRVRLFEKSDRLGGQWNIASSMEHKKHFEDFTRQVIAQCYESGAEVVLNREITPQLVQESKPDVVVVATGASPKSLNVPGCDKPHVVQAVDVIAGQAKAGHRVAVIGGRLVGMEVADMLVRKGKRVVLATKNRLGENGHAPERNVFVTLKKRLADAGVKILPNCLLVEIDDRGIYLDCEGELVYIESNTVILAVGAEPNSKIIEAFRGSGIPMYVIGDCLEPRDAKDAVNEGATVGLRI